MLVARNNATAAPQEQITLMQTLAAWKYPDTQMPNGASMSDGGSPGVQSVKCAAVLTTPDPIDKVIAFYTEKLGPGEARSVAVQDDSERASRHAPRLRREQGRHLDHPRHQPGRG